MCVCVCVCVCLCVCLCVVQTCLAKGTSECSAEFDVVWITNAKDITKYIAKKSTHWLFPL